LQYLNLKNTLNTQLGGFYLRDENKNFFLMQILNRISDNKNIFDYNNNDKILNFETTYKYFMNDDKYNEIYSYLMNTYNKDLVYEQLFINSERQIIFRQPDVHQYHINFAALIFLNYIIELELFTLISSIVKTNTISSPDNNDLIGIYCNSKTCTRTRIYKDNTLLSIDIRFKQFSEKLDNLFTIFMNYLIDNLSSKLNINHDELLKLIVPIDHIDHIPNTFDFIYVNWKDRLNEYEQKAYNRGGYSSKIKIINNCIQNALIKLEEMYTDYTAEGLGFFSFMHLKGITNKEYFGSCITFSLFELYIMSRLHTHAKNLHLVLESAHQERRHGYWNFTQDLILPNIETNSQSITHWSTRYSFSESPFKMRDIYLNQVELNFVNNKSIICQALLYPIIDSYINYISQNIDCCKEYLKNIRQLIIKRVTFIESKISGKYDEKLFREILDKSLKIKMITFMDISRKYNVIENKDLIFRELKLQSNLPDVIENINKYKIDRYGNVELVSGNHGLLYLASRSGNVNLVENILQLEGIDVNIISKDGSTPLHGAAYGFDDNKCNERLKICKLLLNKNADKNLVNNYGENPYNNIRCGDIELKKQFQELLR
jgi:hypothetical protein